MSPEGGIVVAIGGGIAAYKVCTVVSQLVQQGYRVQVILSAAAAAFVTPLTTSTLGRCQTYTDQDFWQPHPRPLHIALAEWAQLVLIAPLTAHTLGKLAHGLADDLLTNLVLASRAPLLLAPAMNTQMWANPWVQRNWEHLCRDPRVHWDGPDNGLLACDSLGTGRMAEPEVILDHLASLYHTQGCRDLRGKQVLITCGATREHLDAVRFLGNPATGKMGLALALAALHRGARVTLVHGPWDYAPPAGVEGIGVTSAAQMRQVLEAHFPRADWLVMNAAVGDVRPRDCHPGKLAKSELPAQLPLEPVPDLLADLAAQKQPHQVLVGFAAQTGDIVPPAQAKLRSKNLDAIFANPVDQEGTGFGQAQNQGVYLDRAGQVVNMGPATKLAIAHQIYDQVQRLSSCGVGL